MPVMDLAKFERLFRAADGVSVDRNDVNRYLDFVNDAIYDLMVIGQATAKANVRDGTDIQPLPAADLNRHRPGAGTEQPRGDKEQTCCKPALT
jgi:hypothetical protein